MHYTYLFRLSYKKDITTFVSFVKRNPFYLELDSTLQIRKMFDRKRRIYEFIVDEILIKVGDEFVWTYIATDPRDNKILRIRVSYQRSMHIAGQFIWFVMRKCGTSCFYWLVCGIFKLANYSNWTLYILHHIIKV